MGSEYDTYIMLWSILIFIKRNFRLTVSIGFYIMCRVRFRVMCSLGARKKVRNLLITIIAIIPPLIEEVFRTVIMNFLQ